jgi:hypothetical protein
VRGDAYRAAAMSPGARRRRTSPSRETVMPKLTTALAALAATGVLAAPAAAQIPHFTPFAFEARAGVAVPTGELGDAAGNGFVVGGSITYLTVPMIGIYAGGTHARMSADAAGDYRDTGLDLGVRVGIPTPLIPIDPWVKGGLVFHRLELSDAGADDFDETGLGFEVGAGLGFGFGPLSITPGIGYVSYRVSAGLTDATISYVKADVGVRIRL